MSVSQSQSGSCGASGAAFVVLAFYVHQRDPASLMRPGLVRLGIVGTKQGQALDKGSELVYIESVSLKGEI